MAMTPASHPLVPVRGCSLPRRSRRPPTRLAGHAGWRETAEVQWDSFSYAFGPVVALAVVGVLALLLRWTFSHGHSLVERRPSVGTPTEYGLLVPVAEPPTFVEAEVMRRRLEE